MTDKHLERMEDAVLEAFGEPPKPSVRAAHLAAIRSQMPEMLPFRSYRRRRMALRAGTVVAGLVFVGGSAMAATGTLPDPVQNAVADAVDAVVDIPGGNAKGGKPKNPIAAANKAEADAYTDAKKAYNACKKEERKTAEASPSATPATSACGEKPQRTDFKAERTPKPEGTERPDRTPNPNASDHTPNPNSSSQGGSNAGGASESHRPARTEKPAKTERPVPPGQPE